MLLIFLRTFETGDVMLSAREVSNKSVFVEVAVKLPSDVKGQPGGMFTYIPVRKDHSSNST